MHLFIATDGACSGNGSANAPAGWGVYVINVDTNAVATANGRLEDCTYEFDHERGILRKNLQIPVPATNNRAEYMAMINAMRLILKHGPINVTIVTDSNLAAETLKTWAQGWIRKAHGNVEEAFAKQKNPDLVSIMWRLYNQCLERAKSTGTSFEIMHTRGHLTPAAIAKLGPKEAYAAKLNHQVDHLATAAKLFNPGEVRGTPDIVDMLRV